MNPILLDIKIITYNDGNEIFINTGLIGVDWSNHKINIFKNFIKKYGVVNENFENDNLEIKNIWSCIIYYKEIK